MAAHPAGKKIDPELLARDQASRAMALLLAHPIAGPLVERTPLDDSLDRIAEDFEDAGPFALASSDIYIELQDLLISKQADYGPHAINRAPGGALNGVLVRLHDKVERLKNLADSDRNPDHESVRDTWRDVANYAVIALMLIDGTWPE